MNSFDSYGWLVVDGGDRQASAEAKPKTKQPVVGDPWPNWTGMEWVDLPYSAPPEFIQPIGDMKITRLAYLNRFGADLETLYTVAQTNVKLQIYRDKVLAATHINLTLPQNKTSLDALVSFGLLAQHRVAEILETPPTAEEIWTG